MAVNNTAPLYACFVLSVPQRLLLGPPNKNNRSKRIAITWGTIGRRKRLSLFSLPIVTPTLSFFPFPSLSMTQRGLYGGERE